jgi:hypothetical protein
MASRWLSMGAGGLLISRLCPDHEAAAAALAAGEDRLVGALETLTTDWVRATDQTKRKQLADEIQKVALREVANERLRSRECRAVCQRRIGQGLEAQRAETEALVGPDPANLWRHRRSAA